MFGQNDFIEIAFLAVRAEAQTRGNGYKIMNELKSNQLLTLDEMQGIKIKWLVVHADNSAIGFFKKNGFS